MVTEIEPTRIAELDRDQVADFIWNSPDVNRRLAASHAVGNFVLLGESDSWNGYHPGQNPLQVRVEGTQMPIEATDFTANLVNERYTETRDELLSDPDVVRKVVELDDHLQAGGNAIVTTPHVKNLVDIAFAEKVVSDIAEIVTGHKTDRGIMIAKSISELGYKLEMGTVSAVNVLRTLCRSTLFSYTRTDSTRDIVADLPKSVVDFMNAQNYRYATRRLDKGGWMQAMVPYATTQEQRDDHGDLILGTISPGTKQMMKRDDVKIFPVYANFKPKSPIVAFPSGLITIRNETDIDSLTRLLADTYETYTPHH